MQKNSNIGILIINYIKELNPKRLSVSIILNNVIGGLSLKATRHNIFNKYYKLYRRMFPRNWRVYQTYLTNLIEANKYEIIITCNGNQIIIKYKAPEFNINDLKKAKAVFGNGKARIVKASNEGKLQYNYTDGYNIYILEAIGSKPFNQTYTMEGPLEENGSAIVNDATMQSAYDIWYITPWYDLMVEVIYNIIHYTNIKDKDIDIIKTIKETRKIGVQKSKF